MVSTPPAVMATRESGRIGEPWVVMAVPGGGAFECRSFSPGTPLTPSGEGIGEVTGNPREMGRELRSILEDLAEGAAA